jgi:hypothetical protein
MAAAPPGADPLGELAAARRRRRLGDLDWFEAFYNAYLAGIGVVVATAVVSTLLPEGEVAASTVDRVRADGAALAGIVLALVVAVGARSGGRGGPIALEPAVVHHVLLAPVDRGRALRGPAVRSLRFTAFVGAGAGAVAGLAAAGRLPGSAAAYVVAGTATGVLTALLAGGTALVVSGHRWPMWAADLLALAVVGLSALDVAAGTSVAPGTWLGALALSPLDLRPVAAAGLVAAVAVPVAGLGGVGGTSLEASLRRAGLVGQLRFAVTMQDLRTVVLLRRQLAQERLRSRPWIRVRPRDGVRLPVFRRDWHGLLRFPAVRVARMAALGAVAGAALHGAWSGTTPLLVVAALALFVAALDAVEPLSQEADRPGAWAARPVPDGRLLVRHLTAPGLVMVLVGLVALAGAELTGPSVVALQLAAVVVPTAAAAAVVAAAASVVMGPPDTLLRVSFPEAAAGSMVFRAAWPPGLVALALAPVLAARAADQPIPPWAAALNVALPVLLVVGAVVAWLGSRKAPIL